MLGAFQENSPRNRILLAVFKGEVDFEAIFGHLKAAGYDRWLSLEVMGGGRDKLEADYDYITGLWNKP